MAKDWKTSADEKRASILNAIPKEWQLKSVPTPEEVRDVTGKYIEQYLSPKEIEITDVRNDCPWLQWSKIFG